MLNYFLLLFNFKGAGGFNSLVSQGRREVNAKSFYWVASGFSPVFRRLLNGNTVDNCAVQYFLRGLERRF